MSAALARTPLFDAHIRAGARMVDFGGWEMPVSYGSQIEEHHAVRRDAGMFDVSHMLAIDISGPGSKDYLRRLLANDVARLAAPGKALYSCMLNPEGGVVDDLIVYFFSNESWRAVVNAATAQADLAWMQRVADSENFAVHLEPRRDLAMLAVQGPNARQKVWDARPSWQAATEALSPFSGALIDEPTMVARTGYTGEDGFEILLPAAQVQRLWDDLLGLGVRPCGLGARDTLRLEAGMNLYGQDMDEEISPLAANMGWTIAWEPAGRDFIGRQALEAQRAAGDQPKLVGLVLEERGVLRAHQVVRVAGIGEGEITSGSFSPTLGKSIALARLPAATGDRAEVEIRGKWYPVRVVQPNFVRHGKALI